MSEIKGYKVFNPDWTCKDFQYEVGKTFLHKGNISMCGSGFHFCQVASDCFNYYQFDSKNKVAEVLAIDLVETEGNKSVTNKITIVREVEWSELLTIVNTGKDCTGLSNTGDWNTGDCNTGNRNTGDRNTGDRNTGDRNTGDRNTGNCNTGNRNTGDRNTGDRNTGDRNTGDWNTGDRNTGWFSTITPKIDLFEKSTNLTESEVRNIKGIQILNWNYENDFWIYEENMSEEEKEKYPKYKTTGGYLKSIPFKDACIIMWNKLSNSDKKLVKEIPNFDSEIFKKITGIDA